jgi:hypothetical protein
MNMYMTCRSQKPRGLRYILSSTARKLGSRVRILLGVWMCVRVLLTCVGRGFESGWSPVQGALSNIQIDLWSSQVKILNRNRQWMASTLKDNDDVHDLTCTQFLDVYCKLVAIISVLFSFVKLFSVMKSLAMQQLKWKSLLLFSTTIHI